MTELFLDYHERVEVTRVATRDEWDRDDTRTERFFEGVHLDRGNLTYYQYSFDTLEDVVEGDIVYVVIGQYTTGDSFGHDDNGSFTVLLASKDEDFCYRALRAAQDKSEKYLVVFEGHDLYRPWVGYFEHLEYLDVHSFIVEK